MHSVLASEVRAHEVELTAAQHRSKTKLGSPCRAEEAYQAFRLHGHASIVDRTR
jgi:hypothetical protein